LVAVSIQPAHFTKAIQHMELQRISAFQADNELESQRKTREQENDKFNAHHVSGDEKKLKKERRTHSLVL
jgi:hypothetical protein